jgi:hypothetical protein
MQNRMCRRGRWGWPAPAGGAGLREVDGRYLRGIPQVERGHEPCWPVAARMARHVMARQLPAVSWRRFPLRGNRACQRTVAGPRGPVLPCRSRDWPGILAGGVNGGRADRISQGVTVSRACPAGGVRPSAAAGRWLSGVPGRVQMRCSSTQLDLMGHDPKPASR